MAYPSLFNRLNNPAVNKNYPSWSLIAVTGRRIASGAAEGASQFRLVPFCSFMSSTCSGGNWSPYCVRSRRRRISISIGSILHASLKAEGASQFRLVPFCMPHSRDWIAGNDPLSEGLNNHFDINPSALAYHKETGRVSRFCVIGTRRTRLPDPCQRRVGRYVRNLVHDSICRPVLGKCCFPRVAWPKVPPRSRSISEQDMVRSLRTRKVYPS